MGRKNQQKASSLEIDESKLSKTPMPNCMKSQNDGVLIRYKGFYYFEVPENDNASSLKNYDTVKGEVEFFKNGKPLGVAHSGDMPAGEYFPTISLYRSCKVRANF